MTCESVMRVLQAHKDSVMAVLEAFVYDPLLNWRLMDCKFNKVVSTFQVNGQLNHGGHSHPY